MPLALTVMNISDTVAVGPGLVQFTLYVLPTREADKAATPTVP